MARWTIKNVRFAGVSACMPKHVVKTTDLPLFNEEEAAVFDNTVGIKERRLGPDTLCASDYHIDVNTDMDYFLIHQANKLIVDRALKKLHLPVEKVPYDLEEFGNLGGISIPSLMVTRIAGSLRANKPTKMLCSSFGPGLSWGTMLLTANNVVVPDLIEI
ncbi:MAG: 3-oxoacyl-[acyl-carrier-protein] synthase III C-terminal domain-containing protein [Paludibacteraceae bacterium]